MNPRSTSSASTTPAAAVGIAVCMLNVQEALAGRAQIFPMGAFRAEDGRPTECPAWQLTPAIAQQLVATASQRTTPYCFDYDHQTLLAKENGKPAPASGWFRTLEVRADGVWATDIEWTPAARQMIESHEYLYTSPVFGYDKKTGEVSSLFNAALTNVPAIDGMAAIAAANLTAALSLQSPSEVRMDELLERLRYLLNLPLTATTDDIVAELDKVKAMIASGEGTAAASLSLVGYLTTLRQERDTAVAAASKQTPTTGTPDPSKFVPMDQFATMQNQVAALSRQIEDGTRAELLEAGLADGRILEPQKDYWSKQPLAALTAYLDVAQPLAALSRTQTGGKEPGGVATGRLTAEQAAVCKRMGLDEATFAKSLTPGA
ncbi:MAG: phage protease [Burkholderia gladioli]